MANIKLQGDAEQRRGIHYEIDTAMEPIGVGGMGQVFKGLMVNEQTGVSKPVAIKFMFDDLPPSAYERARREANIRLHNDNLVEMLGFLETQEPDGFGSVKKHYHVVSELLEGVSLSDLLDGKTLDRYGKEVPYAVKLLQDYRNDSEHFARTVVMSVITGLMALHDAGYIHRDIDPTNIMVTNDGHIKLIDFGIAKQMNTLTTNDKSLTVAGKFMGKPEYAAPELALGDIKHQNQTTDIYAVGILLYQCITGHPPFEGPSHEILQKQLKEKVPLSPVKNKALRNIIATACEKRQELRYQTSAQMRVALEQVGQARSSVPWAGTKWTIIGIAATVVLLAVIGALFMMTGAEAEGRGAEVEGQRLTASGETGGGAGSPVQQQDDMAYACSKLKDPATAKQGLAMLEKLAEGDDAAAVYLLSRLYFVSEKADDLCPDSIRQMQQALSVSPDNAKAHSLLLRTIELEPTNYYALYDLGCDFMGGAVRNKAVERDVERGYGYFEKAMQYASSAHDEYYMKLIQQKLDIYRNDF